MQIISIHSTIVSKRVDFVFDFVFKEVLNVEWQYAVDAISADIVYGECIESKLSYASSNMLQEGFFPKKVILKNGKLYFDSNDFFDPFSAIFYCLSRMEELNAPKDNHGRFSGDSSVFLNQLETPWVDVWIDDLKQALNIEFKPKSEIKLTVDLDFGYRYLGKGIVRSLAAFCKEVVTLHWNSARLRLKAWVMNADPYDAVYSWLAKEFQATDLRFFALMSPFGQYDKGLNPDSNSWKRLKQQLSHFPFGLHPSYHHIEKETRLEEGFQKLQSHGFEIQANRFHFLRYRIDQDYQRLMDIGIFNDYSMGFADRIGFRAQTSRSFFFYDLQKENCSKLRIHPFVCMDAVLCNYGTLSADEMKLILMKISSKIHALGGTMCLLWHDHTLMEGSDTRLLLEEILTEWKV